MDLGTGWPIAGTEWYYERIGFLYGMVPFPFCGWSIDSGENLRCYWDDEVTYVHPLAPGGTAWCDVALGASGTEQGDEVVLFPNPGSDQLTVVLPEGLNSIALLDGAGRVVAAQSGLSGASSLGTYRLSSGPYLIRFEASDGTRTTLRWVKE